MQKAQERKKTKGFVSFEHSNEKRPNLLPMSAIHFKIGAKNVQ